MGGNNENGVMGWHILRMCSGGQGENSTRGIPALNLTFCPDRNRGHISKTWVLLVAECSKISNIKHLQDLRSTHSILKSEKSL